MRCNCQMSFSSSFERPRFKLRSHRKRIDNTTIIGRPMASVARMMLKNSESRAVRDWVIGSLHMQASESRIQQRGSDDKQRLIAKFKQQTHVDSYSSCTDPDFLWRIRALFQ